MFIYKIRRAFHSDNKYTVGETIDEATYNSLGECQQFVEKIFSGTQADLDLLIQKGQEALAREDSVVDNDPAIKDGSESTGETTEKNTDDNTEDDSVKEVVQPKRGRKKKTNE